MAPQSSSPLRSVASERDASEARLASLGRALAAAAGELEQPRFLALTHESPDPDALGALVGVRTLLEEHFGYAVSIATVGEIHRAENLAMVRELGLHFADLDQLDVEGYQGVLLVDSQPGFGHTQLPENPPTLAVFDHHQAPSEGNSSLARVPHIDVREDAGATASIVYDYLTTAGVELDVETATALFCGVRYDTGDLSHDVSQLDEEAWYETFRRADRQRVARIGRPSLPEVYYSELVRSLTSARRHGTLVLGLLGEVANPESVAEMADFFLRMEGCAWSLVGGCYEGTYYVSLRTQLPGGYAYPLLERVLDGRGSFGGHGRVAGGRIPLDEDSETAVQRLESRLRARALEILAGARGEEGWTPVGTPVC